jgi:hypothetical protein
MYKEPARHDGFFAFSFPTRLWLLRLLMAHRPRWMI